MALETDGFESSVKNISGVTMYFPFLPPHGHRLANNETVTYFGDLFTNIGARSGGKRKLLAFKAAISDGDLTVVKQPNPIVWDDGVDDTRVIVSVNNVVETDGPFYESADA